MEEPRFFGAIAAWAVLFKEQRREAVTQFPTIQRAVIDAPPELVVAELSPAARLCVFADHLAAPKMTVQ